MFTRQILAIGFALLACVPRAVASESVLSFGIPPQQSATELAKRWTPIMQYLSEKTGLPVQMKTAKDIAVYQHDVLAGVFDVAFINPSAYVAASKTAGYRVFAKEKGVKALCLIVVRNDSRITSLEQLQGQTMAFPSTTAVMATIIPLKHLADKKIAVKTNYVVSMDSVYRSVAKGLFPAGGGEGRTFGALDPEIKSQLHVLWEWDGLPSFPFFAHPRVAPATVAKLQQAMVEMGNDPQGQALLKAVNIKMLEKAEDREYDMVRKMNLPLEVK
jgi:phosphonate transport system substrate-binding protein